MSFAPAKIALALAALALAAATLVGCTIFNDVPFPTVSNVGVPAGTVLTPYAGPTTITKCGTVIDHADVTSDLTITVGNGARAIYNNEATAKAGACVTITNSRVHGIIDDKYTSKGFGPVYMADSEVANRAPARDVAAVSQTNVHIWRSYLHGARSGVQCDGYCEVHDSYLIADTEYGAAHMDGFISNGAYGAPILLDHNTVACVPLGPVPNGAGCAAALGFFGDFSAQSNVTVTFNQILPQTADAWCLRTGQDQRSNNKPYPIGNHLVWIGNVFPRGGAGSCIAKPYDWTPSLSAANSDQWCGNVDDASPPKLIFPEAETCGP